MQHITIKPHLKPALCQQQKWTRSCSTSSQIRGLGTHCHWLRIFPTLSHLLRKILPLSCLSILLKEMGLVDWPTCIGDVFGLWLTNCVRTRSRLIVIRRLENKVLRDFFKYFFNHRLFIVVIIDLLQPSVFIIGHDVTMQAAAWCTWAKIEEVVVSSKEETQRLPDY